MKIDILGTQYSLIEADPREDSRLAACGDGYCDTSTKQIVVDSMLDLGPTCKGNMEEHKKGVKRHELIHAFLAESGLDVCSAWAKEEEAVDWIALQFPKLMKAFKAADAL